MLHLCAYYAKQLTITLVAFITPSSSENVEMKDVEPDTLDGPKPEASSQDVAHWTLSEI